MLSNEDRLTLGNYEIGYNFLGGIALYLAALGSFYIRKPQFIK